MIPKYRSRDVQPLLWPEPISGHGCVRYVVGNLFEDLTAEYLQGKRHKTQGNCAYCPDVSVQTPAGMEYYESKAVGLNGTAFIYAGRLDKDKEFTNQGNALFYAIWRHKAQTKLAETIPQLEQMLLERTKSIAIVPFECIYKFCLTLPVVRLNSAYGHARTQVKTYGSGYRFPITKLSSFVRSCWVDGITPEIRASWRA